ncbi:hypothetical protein DL96DRAFT_1706357 [Flagelloscypha sp. PMI_526]|nr:hypothetical protein DL96DRAFT_1706357 [Flagelloscypha sp. PMI_526]
MNFSDPSFLEDVLLARREQQYLLLVNAVVFYWDYLLTLDHEIHFFWKSSFSRSSLWFFANRYILFLAILPLTITGVKPLSPQVRLLIPYLTQLRTNVFLQACTVFNLARSIIIFMTQIIVGVTLAIRTYALHQRSRNIAYFLTALGVLVAGGGIYVLFIPDHTVLRPQDAPFQSCVKGLPRRDAYVPQYHIVCPISAVGSEGVMVAESVMFVLTMLVTYRTHLEQRVHMFSLSLVDLLRRDGITYYSVVLAVNFANILTFYLGNAYQGGCVALLASTLSSMMMSHLFLNLRSATNPPMFPSDRASPNISFRLQTDTNRLQRPVSNGTNTVPLQVVSAT